MKTLSVIVLAAVAFLAGNSAFAGRDETQTMMLRNAAQAKQAEQLAKEKQAQQGLAGPTGVKGQIGPGEQPRKLVRDPAFHP